MELRNSEAIIIHSRGQGALLVQWAGMGQQVEPTKCRAGGGWVRRMHTATRPRAKQTWMSLLSTQHDPSLQGGHTTLTQCGVPTDFV